VGSAAEMILIAARTAERANIAEATRQMLVAFGHANWRAAGQITDTRRTPCLE
jgi:hypothetical protein